MHHLEPFSEKNSLSLLLQVLSADTLAVSLNLAFSAADKTLPRMDPFPRAHIQ
jgi:hypothetical protein